MHNSPPCPSNALQYHVLLDGITRAGIKKHGIYVWQHPATMSSSVQCSILDGITRAGIKELCARQNHVLLDGNYKSWQLGTWYLCLATSSPFALFSTMYYWMA
jgi:hypothetical protein